jgi:hypothetical protein
LRNITPRRAVKTTIEDLIICDILGANKVFEIFLLIDSKMSNPVGINSRNAILFLFKGKGLSSDFASRVSSSGYSIS